ncbi:hypothetical protein Tco_0252224 [Tanacetum coccineum]
MVKGGEDEEPYASQFVDSMLNDDVDDSSTRIEPESYKEHPKYVNDEDEEIEKEKKDDKIDIEKKDDDVEKTDKVVKEKDNDEELTATTSKDSFIHKRKKRSIPYKMKILPGSIAGMCRRHGQIRSHIKNKFITHDFFMGKIQVVLDHCNKVVPEMTIAKTNKMIKEEIPHLDNLAVNKDREVDPINAQEMISKEFATQGPK